ncbi:GrpB family protein [Curtobacterium sp. PhB115]|uniref:GrpB family protein n=1 Tax=Curtobacterium sp. PhB115 TaxID=2485173 RepID=UPI001609505F|nr:GrpB family protein [Curtobacterium sp. PhB115]
MEHLETRQSSWAVDFAQEASRLFDVVRPLVTDIEHIGSTAIPGLEAKPVIDMAARAAPDVDPHQLGPVLAAAGYTRHTAGPKNHGVYTREHDGQRTHILHVFADGQWDDCNQRLFRDRLLRDPAARSRYRDVKTRAAAAFSGRAYTAAKSQIVQELLDDERAARGLAPTMAWDK